MGYFRELPNLEYLSPLSDRNSASEYIQAKNIFKRVKLREDFHNSFTRFEKYQIVDGERPDQVAKKLYDSSKLDWVVLISAGITNVRNEWPLAERDLYEFALSAYGADINATRFYETIEVKDSKDRVILPAGQVVDYNFKLPTPKIDTSPTSSYVQYWDSGLNQLVTKTQVTKSISNYQYETRENNKKRGIYVLRNNYLQQFLNDTRGLMKYKRSSQYVSERLKRTENLRVKSP
tara:strand:- start:78 stop:779 length:702 start_codon:yes stop_codon:yes gene_type:complete